jgi:hypothetical protein
MHSFRPIRFAAVAGLALSASLPAQSPEAKPVAPAQAAPSQTSSTQTSSTLPATPPTTPEPPPVPPTPSQLPPKRAQITYTNGTLSVSADNASLNQILREIATDTGMKITGGVTEERVFGQYGPDDPAQILAQLLDGTGSNMILVHRDADAPAELILTPRQGAPTPPNPNAAAFDNRIERFEPREAPPVQGMQPEPGSSVPAPPPVGPGANPGTPNGNSPANSSQPDSPNGVKTPQQIYEQLQRMRQQQQQTTQPQ